MYSRYPNYRFAPGVRVPENYSGSAFSAPSSAPSHTVADEPSEEIISKSECTEYASPDTAKASEDCSMTERECAPHVEKKPPKYIKPFGFKFDIGRIFSHGFGFEELLLVALILLVSQSECDDDLIIFLAILLFVG